MTLSSSDVIPRLVSFYGDTSVVVLTVLCFGVEFLCCLYLICKLSYILCNWVVTYWKIAVHSANDMLFLC